MKKQSIHWLVIEESTGTWKSITEQVFEEAPNRS